MDRTYYKELAKKKLAMPIGADLVLAEKAGADKIRLDGQHLGEVLVEAARRYRTPLAFPLMDLQIERDYLLHLLGLDPSTDGHSLDEDSVADRSPEAFAEQLEQALPTPKMEAATGAIRRVAQEKDLLPMGMCIGPFSLLTKLIEDPITTIYMASNEDEGEDEHDYVHAVLEIATAVISRWIGWQIDAGAKAVCVCEPAANTVYLSPKQLEADPDLFDRLVVDYNLRLTRMMEERGVDLVFHDCGELSPLMLDKFRRLNPAILSLGSPVPLWEAVPHTGPDTVLFGNLPSKKFFSDKEYPDDRLRDEAKELRAQMDATGHPYILGSECDVLAVTGCECAIHRKTRLLLEC